MSAGRRRAVPIVGRVAVYGGWFATCYSMLEVTGDGGAACERTVVIILVVAIVYPRSAARSVMSDKVYFSEHGSLYLSRLAGSSL